VVSGRYDTLQSPKVVFFGGRLESARSKSKDMNAIRNGSELMCIELATLERFWVRFPAK